MRTREEQEARKKLRCKFFNGTGNKACEANVDYDMVKDTLSSPYHWPCMADGSYLPCACREYYTAEELKAQDDEINNMLANMTLVRGMIIKQTGGTRNTSGWVDCPICQTGKVEYSVAYNGHVHAKCETDHCIEWIE